MSEQDVAAVHTAAEQAALGRREHYHQNILGQGANAGDLQPAESTQQPPALAPPRMSPGQGQP
jgi:hypothetical protein